MKTLCVLAILLTVSNCDFSTPNQNQLVNFNEPIIFFSVGNTNARIESLPNNIDVTETSNWSIFGSVFSINLQSTTTRTHDTDNGEVVAEGFHPTFHVYLESTKPVELAGFDSLNSSISIEAINSNPIFDNLSAVENIQVQVKAADETQYTKIDDINSLRNSAVPYTIRFFFVVRSGVNFSSIRRIFVNGVPRDVTEFYTNNATYNIQLRLQGLYR